MFSYISENEYKILLNYKLVQPEYIFLCYFLIK